MSLASQMRWSKQGAERATSVSALCVPSLYLLRAGAAHVVEAQMKRVFRIYPSYPSHRRGTSLAPARHGLLLAWDYGERPGKRCRVARHRR